ncbi:hypothetical protein [Nonlabens xiamenensis]|uniref:hypothetical protein n=1 Tax=Nonlabens xiamenensis TaxID=2341043 RepID=UPI000F61339C|nr:hypothetical protein [Nonlabens xiamenensis]
MTDSDSPVKKYFSFFLALLFIGIGGWKLYEKWVLEMEMESYKWVLATGLFALGIYQLYGFLKKPKE